MTVNLAEKVFVNHYGKLGSMNAYWMRVCGVKECVELQNATVEAVYNQHGGVPWPRCMQDQGTTCYGSGTSPDVCTEAQSHARTSSLP